MKRPLLATLFFLATTAGPILAQDAPVSVRGFGGVSFLSDPGAVLGATVAIRLSPNLEAIGDVGRLTNMLPVKIQRDLDGFASEMGTYYGAPLTIDGRAPAIYAFGGLRARRTIGHRMTLFIDGGAGVARGWSRIRAVAGGVDVSPEVVTALHIKRSEQQPLVSIGGGVGIPLTTRLGLDLGYRYMRIFTEDPRINIGTMTGGFSWRF
jgi:hypothetical protein